MNKLNLYKLNLYMVTRVISSFYIVIIFLIISFFSSQEAIACKDDKDKKENSLIQKELNLFDVFRNRKIPADSYISKKYTKGNTKLPLVLINSGHGIMHKKYSFLANNLALQGYFVLTIQHDLPTDPVFPKGRELFLDRMQFWKIGIENIKFVLNHLESENKKVDISKIVLIGHSHGGDIALMFAALFPYQVKQLVSLDSLRYPFPKQVKFPILWLRSYDRTPDSIVYPKRGVKTINLKNVKHVEMCDNSSEKIKQKIIFEINEFLK